LLVACGFADMIPSARSAEAPAADRRPLRWGGDSSGGGPYIIEKPGGAITGFEVELADYLARELGRKPEFVQGTWPQLPDLLGRGDIDLVLNGYEWSPALERRFASTIPYYVYKLQLIAHKDGPVRSWDDLPGKNVGVLKGSAADRYLEQRYGNRIGLRAFDTGVTDVMDLVQKRNELQATLQDMPVALYYLPEFPDLRPIEDPVEPGYYVIYVRRDDQELLGQLNDALRKAIRGGKDGSLGRIYEKYHLWNADQEQLAALAEGPWPPASDTGPGVWARLPEYSLTLLKSAGMTALLSCLAMPLAMLVGLLVAVGRLYGPAWLSRPLGWYVEFLRGTPLLLQLYFIYFLLPDLGLRLPAFWAGVLGMAMNYSAYEAENYRAGLLAIPRGQMEAALALGMTKWTALRRVVIPQAVRLVIPPVTNDFIALFKDTSVCSVIAVNELTGRFYRLYNNNRDMLLELAVLTAVLYLLMSIPLSLVARRLEQRFPRVVT
jgi:polar amino acid transport system substrate-binding protein